MASDEGLITYTGIGARAAPEPILDIIENIGKHMAGSGYLLRSGGADGASRAFENGCDAANGKKSIFLPWRGFNGNPSNFYNIPDMAFSIMKDFEIAWSTLSDSSKKLQARYVLTILGEEASSPSKCVICYTEGGRQKGGTGRALKIAVKYNVPVFDVGMYMDDVEIIRMNLIEFLRGLSLNADGL